MALWRKHRFISLQEQDGQDSIVAGTQFIVKRVGSTCVENLEPTMSEEILIAFYKDLLDLFQCEQGCLLRLLVDLSGAVLYDKDGDMLQRFELSDIRDVIYSTKTEKYSRYFILVGREESEMTVKAHVLFCEDKIKAKQLYDTFIEVFALGAEARKYRRQVSDKSAFNSETTLHGKTRINNETTISSKDSTIVRKNGVVNTHGAHGIWPRRQTWTKSTTTCPRNERIQENESNDSFTELARSRSSSSNTSMKPDISDINGNRLVWLDTDVFV